MALNGDGSPSSPEKLRYLERNGLMPSVMGIHNMINEVEDPILDRIDAEREAARAKVAFADFEEEDVAGG